jgi:flagellar M-ring protein FliF
MASVGEAMSQVIQRLRDLSPFQRVAFVLVVVGGLVGMISLVVWTNRPDYSVLYSTLSEKDAAAVVSKLKEMKIPYQLGGGGTSILIPSQQVYDTRLQLATHGLPQTGGVGFEIFDRTNFGMTDFMQQLNYQRALQGELSRTVNQFSEVEKSRVHLTIPKESLFLEEQEEARASVILQLRQGTHLNRNQLQGIIHLVASSVEGLSPQNITVVDTQGHLLSEGGDSDPLAQLGQSQWEFQTNLERALEKRVQTMLEKAVGENRVIVRVSADLDFKQIEETEETYDPEASAVRSEQRSEEKTENGYPGSSGIPGVRSNVPPGGAQSGSTGSSKLQRSNETINYEINRRTRRVVEPTGRIRKLSVAVLLDGSYENVAGEDESTTVAYIPRTPEEMNRYESIVKRAIGYNAERGDQVEVANVSFQGIDANELGIGTWDQVEKQRFWSGLVRHGVTLLSLLLFFLFILRPLVRWLTTRHTVPDVQQMLPHQAGGLGTETPRLAGPEEWSNRQKLIELAQGDQERFTRLVETWLK